MVNDLGKTEDFPTMLTQKESDPLVNCDLHRYKKQKLLKCQEEFMKKCDKSYSNYSGDQLTLYGRLFKELNGRNSELVQSIKKLKVADCRS